MPRFTPGKKFHDHPGMRQKVPLPNRSDLCPRVKPRVGTGAAFARGENLVSEPERPLPAGESPVSEPKRPLPAGKTSYRKRSNLCPRGKPRVGTRATFARRENLSSEAVGQSSSLTVRTAVLIAGDSSRSTPADALPSRTKNSFNPNSEIGMGSAAAPAAVRRALAPNSEASDNPKRLEHFAPPGEPRGRGSLRPRRARSPNPPSVFGVEPDGARAFEIGHCCVLVTDRFTPLSKLDYLQNPSERLTG